MTPAPAAPPGWGAPLRRGGVSVGEGVRVLLGVPYAQAPGVRPVELDLYLPPGPGPFPAVVFVHGGGWRTGSRSSAGPMAPVDFFERVAARGLAVASVDYRLSGEATWPAPVHDVAAAVRWLRHRAGDIGIDPARIGAWGESAGAQLALVLTLGGAAVAGDDGPVRDASVAAVVGWYPPTDLASLPAQLGTDPGDPTTLEALLLGGPVSERPDAAAHASPVTYARPDAPPVLLLHGEADSLVPCAQSESLRNALARAGAPVLLRTYAGADHLWRGAPDVMRDATERSVQFLLAHLG